MKMMFKTIPGKRTSRHHQAPGASPHRQELGGFFSTRQGMSPPLHLAAGSIEIDDETIVCDCDFGCDSCSPEPTKTR